MKLGVVTTSFPRYPGDAAGHFVASHVELLRAAGHAVEVIAAGDATAPPPQRLTTSFAPHPAILVQPAPSSPPWQLRRLPSRLFFRGGAPEAIATGGAAAALAFSSRLAAAVARRARRWDAAIAHWLAPCALAALPSRGPLLAVAHGSDVHLLARLRLLAPTLTLLLTRSARLVFVSDELRRRSRAAVPRPLRRAFDDAAIVQPMGVALPHFAAIHHLPRPCPRRYVLILARLVPVKGLELALAAAADAAFPTDVELVIAGDGPERGALEQRARALTAPVHFLGELPTEARDAWLAHAAAVLVPSRRLEHGRSEGMPVVAWEALAAGVPVLAAAVGGLADLPPPARLLPEGAGADRWAAALRDLLAAPPPPAALRQLAQRADWGHVAPTLWAHWWRGALARG